MTQAMNFRSAARWAHGKPWLGSCVAAVLAWAATVFSGHGHGAGDLVTVALSFSAFTILVPLGQMLVISAGPGNALSIPSVIALSGAVLMIVMGRDAMIVPGLLAAVGAGVAVGAANHGLIRLLRIAPTIATLAASLIVMSVAINVGRGLKIKPPPLFAELTRGSWCT